MTGLVDRVRSWLAGGERPQLPGEAAASQSGGVVRVVVGGDPFRLAEDGTWEQRYNVECMRAIATGIFDESRAEIIGPGDLGVVFEHGTDNLAFWVASRIAPLGEEVEARFRSLLGGSVYVGFETPDDLWHIVTDQTDIALDLRIHPCRFARDYYFLGRAHGLDLGALVNQAALRREIKFAAAGLRLGYLASKDVSNAPPLDALLALQMPADSALLEPDGGFASISDHGSEISEIAATHRILWVKPHPHSPAPADALRSVLRIVNARFARMDTYSLIASGLVRTVTAISSSVLHEAEAMGLNVVALRPELSHGMPVRSEYSALRLSDLLGPVANAANVRKSATVLGEQRTLRELIAVGWSSATAGSRFRQPAPEMPLAGSALQSPGLASAWTSGWHDPESWGIWSDGFGVVDFAWPPDNPDEITMAVTAAVYCGDAEGVDDIEIWAGGALSLRARLQDSSCGLQSLEFKVSRPPHGLDLQVVFWRERALCPAETADSFDNRRLGTAIGTIGRVVGRSGRKPKVVA